VAKRRTSPNKGHHRDPNKLTAREQRYCVLYVELLHIGRAAEGAGYSKRSASSIGSQLMRKPRIRKEIERQFNKWAKMSQGEIIRRLEAQATADMSAFMLPGTTTIDPDKIHEFGPLVKEIWKTEEGWRIKLYDSQNALIQLAKTQAMFVERHIFELLDGMDIVEDEAESPNGKAAARSYPAPSRQAS
jgi:hypothetical protein